MSLAEVEAGKRRLLAMLHGLDKDASGTFLTPSAGEVYRFDIRLGAKSVRLEFHAEELEDLAHNGRVKTGIEAQLKITLASLK